MRIVYTAGAVLPYRIMSGKLVIAAFSTRKEAEEALELDLMEELCCA